LQQSYPAVLVSGLFHITVEIEYLHPISNITSEDRLQLTLFEPDYKLPTVLGGREVLEERSFLPRFLLSREVRWKDENDKSFTSQQVVDEALSLLINAINDRRGEPR